eukprot:197207-Chlamydomonas_euryale.AAC.1
MHERRTRGAKGVSKAWRQRRIKAKRVSKDKAKPRSKLQSGGRQKKKGSKFTHTSIHASMHPSIHPILHERLMDLHMIKERIPPKA